MKKTIETRTSWNEVQGARGAETGIHAVIHEDFEHRATLQCLQNVGFARF